MLAWATAGAAAAFALAAKSAADDRAMLERSTLGLGRGTGATASQLEAISIRNADPKLSASSARDITAALASTGQISTSVFDTVISKATDFSKLIGQDLPSATTILAAAFSDPARGADDLAAKMGGLDDKTRQLIQTQIEQGDKTGAQTTLADYLKRQVEANTQAVTGWASAWLTVSGAADKAWESLKRAAGVTVGSETKQQEIDRLRKSLSDTSQIMNDPLGYDSEGTRARIARLEKEKAVEEAAAAAKAADERANKISTTAGDVARGLDPNYAQYRDLVAKRAQIQAALDDPAARAKLADVQQTEEAGRAYQRAIDTMVDANGRMISSAERSRQADQLRAEALKATTAEEKAAVAERQKAFDLAGKPLTGLDAGGQITRAGMLARLQEQSKGGGGADSKDEFDRATKTVEDQIRRMQEQNATFGMAAEAVAKYRTETELLTAAKRADRDITPSLTQTIQGLANESAAAAAKQEMLRDSLRSMDDIRNTGRSVLSGLGNDLARGATFADALHNGLSKVESKLIDLGTSSVIDQLFGKSGTTGTGLLGGLFGGSSGFSLKTLLGFDAGGYTGPGGRLEAAGIVHKGEIVWSQSDISRAGGVGIVERMRRGVGAYADGGIVGGARFVMPRSATMQPAASSAPINNFYDQRPAGSPDADVSMRRNSSGGVDVVLRTIGDGIAKNGTNGRGPFRQQFNTPATRIG